MLAVQREIATGMAWNLHMLFVTLFLNKNALPPRLQICKYLRTVLVCLYDKEKLLYI